MASRGQLITTAFVLAACVVTPWAIMLSPASSGNRSAPPSCPVAVRVQSDHSSNGCKNAQPTYMGTYVKTDSTRHSRPVYKLFSGEYDLYLYYKGSGGQWGIGPNPQQPGQSKIESNDNEKKNCPQQAKWDAGYVFKQNANRWSYSYRDMCKVTSTSMPSSPSPTAPTPVTPAPTPSPTPVPDYATVGGCPPRGGAIEYRATSTTAAVRCCNSDGSGVASSVAGCKNGKTLAQAQQHCSSKGKRLCTLYEILDGNTCSKGCGFDSQRIWTSSSITDPTPNPTPAPTPVPPTPAPTSPEVGPDKQYTTRMCPTNNDKQVSATSPSASTKRKYACCDRMVGVDEPRVISSWLVQTGTSPVSVMSQTIDVVKGQTYMAKVSVLQNDLGSSGERIASVKISTGNGQNIVNLGACKPYDYGYRDDYACTPFFCGMDTTIPASTTQNGKIKVEYTVVGHSWDCDCDLESMACSEENTVPGRTKVTFAAKLTLEPRRGDLVAYAPLSRSWGRGLHAQRNRRKSPFDDNIDTCYYMTDPWSSAYFGVSFRGGSKSVKTLRIAGKSVGGSTWRINVDNDKLCKRVSASAFKSDTIKTITCDTVFTGTSVKITLEGISGRSGKLEICTLEVYEDTPSAGMTQTTYTQSSQCGTGPKTLDDAKRFCSDGGHRLCSRDEISSRAACQGSGGGFGSGCYWQSSQIWTNDVAPTSATSQQKFWTSDGCPTRGTNHALSAVLGRESKNVACCSDSDGLVECKVKSLGLGCSQMTAKNHGEAAAICSRKGMRLCSRKELSIGTCCQKGCNIDSSRVWTSDIEEVGVTPWSTSSMKVWTAQICMRYNGNAAPATQGIADDTPSQRVSNRKAVACCYPSGIKCYTQELGLCGAKTEYFSDARALCVSKGARLCTLKELTSNICC
eukprot:TRINITY_DN11432_c0_g1_i2.p1 TRINITY_DN11432_c0_g1~~TRINITY_DN11432_c0_g1_i2.p1  ORF type:complete len:932 (-),score=86.27 TRINITY_DN11432_c0_g1_i2:146-2863(-)